MLQVVTYFFYKNLTFTLTQFWFTFQTGFSGQRFYDDWFQSLYNVIFTALPVIMVGLFDKVLHSLGPFTVSTYTACSMKVHVIGLVHHFCWENMYEKTSSQETNC